MKEFFIFFLIIYTLSFSAESKSKIKRTLTLEDRINCQKKIEEIYWDHRVWPPENPQPKLSLSSVISDEVIKLNFTPSKPKSIVNKGFPIF